MVFHLVTKFQLTGNPKRDVVCYFAIGDFWDSIRNRSHLFPSPDKPHPLLNPPSFDSPSTTLRAGALGRFEKEEAKIGLLAYLRPRRF